MLILKFDITCGFNNLYLVEKNVEFPIALIRDQELVNRIFKRDSALANVSDQWLLDNYSDNAEQLLKDYDILEMIKFIVRVDIAGSYLYSVCFNRAKPVIPGVCELDNIRLEEIDEDEGLFIDREIQAWENAALAFNCFEEAEDQEDDEDEFSNWDGKVYQA